jgi:hypothetical protein
MVPVSTAVSRQRSERRIAVRLPLRVRGRDKRGVLFEEETSSENLCRNGAAFVTRFDVALGSNLEIRIPISYYSSRRADPELLRLDRSGNGSALANSSDLSAADGIVGRSAFARSNQRASFTRNDREFATQGRVVHVHDSPSQGEKLVGVQFTGPRFQRVFRSESAA